MITVGVDLAAEPASTAVVRIDWRPEPVVVDVRCPADDEAVVTACSGADKIGIDCPFGWPIAFVEFVTAHQRGAAVPRADSIAARRRFAYRTTDLWCRQQGLRPLSVSADRIAHAALRCAGLVQRLGETDRSGAGRVVEVYPAGTLRRWGDYVPGYKRHPAAVADAVVAAAGLRFGAGADPGDLVHASDHALDALVCALTARAAALGHVLPIPDGAQDAARIEGWIALPTCRADELGRARPGSSNTVS